MQKSNRALFIVVGGFLLMGLGLKARPATEGHPEINWLSIETASGKLQKEQRPVLIDLYTTWCGWCKQMDRKTYSNKHVAEYVEAKFHPVKLDAETRDAINWKGRTFNFNPGAKVNDFAMYLTRGQLEFPTTVILLPTGEYQAFPGYMEPRDLELLLKYFGEGKYQSQSIDQFQKSFKASW